MDAESLHSDTDKITELMYSTADLAKRLKVGPAMVRKWAIAYETATGDKVRLKSKRDGREFTAGQVATIAAVKKMVDKEGFKIDTAFRMFIGQPELAPTIIPDELESLHTSQALQTILEKHDETNRLLLEEIRGLRQDLQARELPAVPSPIEEKSYTLLQVWVKRLFGV